MFFMLTSMRRSSIRTQLWRGQRDQPSSNRRYVPYRSKAFRSDRVPVYRDYPRIHDPIPFSAAQGIFWLSWDSYAVRYITRTFKRGERGRERGVCTLVLSWLFQGGSINVDYADCPFVMSAGITVFDCFWFCNCNYRKNYLRPFKRDVLHRPLCEDSEKIPDGGASNNILHLSGSDGKKFAKFSLMIPSILGQSKNS